MSPGGRGGSSSSSSNNNGSSSSPTPPTLSFNSFVRVLVAVADDIQLPPGAEPRDPRDPTAAMVLKVHRTPAWMPCLATIQPLSSLVSSPLSTLYLAPYLAHIPSHMIVALGRRAALLR